MSAKSCLFPARIDALRRVRAFIESFCTEYAIPRTAGLRLNLVIEELFTNAVRHGHAGDSDAPIWVELQAEDHAVRVVFEDTAPPFNPYARLPDEPPDTTLEMRKIGGLGVLLTRELASSRDYAYLYGRNCIRLRLAR